MKTGELEKVFLYDEGTAETLDIGEIAEYLSVKLGRLPLEIRGKPFASSPEKSNDYAGRLASIKIQDMSRKMTPQEPLHGEVQYEKRRILGKTKSFGVVYDGSYLLDIFSELVPRDERVLGFIHIIITNRLFASWEEGDKRYHARTSVYGFPSVISTTGIVEAPARPRDYYLLKQQYEMLGKSLLEVTEKFKGRFIDYEDERLTEVVKGYVMQAVFYALAGDPFCKNKGCRLYNAHWQEELIFAQLESPHEFCGQHRGILDSVYRQ